MTTGVPEFLNVRERVRLEDGILVLAFSGWMDGGDVSTGTVGRLVEVLQARPIATIDPDPFYIYNVPGPMEITALFRPNVKIEDGIVKTVEMPRNIFFSAPNSNLLLFIGKEPNLRWRSFGDCILHLVRETGVSRLVFVGSFGGSVPHTRQPRVFVSSSDASYLPKLEPYGTKRSGYEGPGSFVTYLMGEAPRAGVQMASLVAEIPGYLQGPNPVSIEAMTRRMATILDLSIDLDALRTASTEWELQVSAAVEQDSELATKIRQLEENYDNELMAGDEDA